MLGRRIPNVLILRLGPVRGSYRLGSTGRVVAGDLRVVRTVLVVLDWFIDNVVSSTLSGVVDLAIAAVLSGVISHIVDLTPNEVINHVVTTTLSRESPATLPMSLTVGSSTTLSSLLSVQSPSLSAFFVSSTRSPTRIGPPSNIMTDAHGVAGGQEAEGVARVVVRMAQIKFLDCTEVVLPLATRVPAKMGGDKGHCLPRSCNPNPHLVQRGVVRVCGDSCVVDILTSPQDSFRPESFPCWDFDIREQNWPLGPRRTRRFLDDVKSSLGHNVELRTIGSGALMPDTVTATYLHDVFFREFAPVVRAHCLDVLQELIELIVLMIFLLPEVYPREAGEVIAHDHGNKITPDRCHRPFPAETHEYALELASTARGGS